MVRILALIIIVALAAACQKEKPKEEVVVNAVPTATNEMPTLAVTLTDGKTVNLRELNGKVLIVCFNPDCDHCQRQGKLISENQDVVKDYQVYFISPDTMENIAKYAEEYKLILPNIHFGRAEGIDVINAVGQINTVPTFFIYQNQAQVARMEGEISLPKMRQMLN